MNENFPDIETYTRCHDANENIDHSCIPRGQAGVAILWSKTLSDKISKLEVGNERIVAIQIELDNAKICLINTYLPTNKPESENAYTECLDVLHDIIDRFEQSHQIILCGDLNGTLLPTRNNKHDILLKDFVSEHRLSTSGHSSLKPTFYHFNGISKSQIDYILTIEQDAFSEYMVGEKEPLNVSSHIPVKVLLKAEYPNKNICAKQITQSKKVYSWNRIDIDKYVSELELSIPSNRVENAEQSIDCLTKCLKLAAEKAVPSKTRKLKGPKFRVSDKVLKSLKTVKQSFKERSAAGKLRTGQLYIENKMAKKQLRALQRRDELVRRKSLYDNLMQNPSSEIFYKLIKKSKSSKESTSTCIQIEERKYLDPVEQRGCFAKYFEDLAMPKDRNYDNVFLELCNVRCDELESDLSSQTEECLQFSDQYVEKAIDKMNTGKSPDEYGLTAEHFKSAKNLLTPIITKVFNQILKEKAVPTSFKTGIITPVLKKGKDAP